MRIRSAIILGVWLFFSLACKSATMAIAPPATPTLAVAPDEPPTALPPIPVQPGAVNPDEPVYISGEIPYSSPFFLNSLEEPFVLLEDQAGFVHRDRQFLFRQESQVIGPVKLSSDKRLTYSLALPIIPQGTMVDVDQDGEQDSGVQVFAVAYWSNTWGDPFLERRDGTGWSTAYASTITDPERDNEVVGGLLIVWAPDAIQGFPSGFGEDGLLFTADDPITLLPAGYSIVDLNQTPFKVYKEARPTITLNEGAGQLNDYSHMTYSQAFTALIQKASKEYPFTEEKKIDWQSLERHYLPRVKQVNNDQDFYKVMLEFALEIPDGHVGISLDNNFFQQNYGGGLGLLLDELEGGEVIASKVITGGPADSAGILPGSEILTWDDVPVQEALDRVVTPFGPSSTRHAARANQLIFLPRSPVGERVSIRFLNPGASGPQEKRLTATAEFDSLIQSIPELRQDELSLPIEGEVLDESGLGYIKISTFNADYRLMARLWDYYLKQLTDNKIPGLIIDLRENGGGNLQLGMDFAGFFFNEEVELFHTFYYSEISGTFEDSGSPARITPAETQYTGQIAVLVGPACASACESFAYALRYGERAILVGHTPTAGMFGEVGRGQYKLPGDYSMQFPTGRSLTPDGKLLIEGAGVKPNITVPVTPASALGEIDAVLEAAVKALLRMIQ